MGVVYGLTASNAEGEIRYIGATTRRLSKRIAEHINAARRGIANPRNQWIREVLASGGTIQATVLAEADGQKLLELEAEFCKKYAGTALNARKGGEPLLRLGVAFDEIASQRQSASQKQRFEDPLERQKVSDRFRGKSKSEEQRTRMSESSRAAQAYRLKAQCPGCALVCYPGGLVHHRKSTGH